MSDAEKQPPAREETASETTAKVAKIERLRGAIHRLDGILEQIEHKDTEAPEESVLINSLENWVTNTEVLANKLEQKDITAKTPITDNQENLPKLKALEAPTSKEEQLTDIAGESEVEEEWEEEASWLDRILPTFTNLQAWWDAILTKIRSFLPASINEKLSDWGLTGILSSLVVIFLLSSVLLLSKSSENIPQSNLKVPPQLTAPQKPKTVALEPLPQPQLTPEQSLIAAIQSQVTEITKQYSEKLILSIEAEFISSNLRVTVSDDWYQLRESRQEKLANDMLSRSRSLNFQKLKIVDQKGNLLARNPVIGDSMVILKSISS